MVSTPGGSSGSDQFSVSPSVLQAAAPKYANAAQDIATLQQALVSAVQLTSGDMFILLEFAELASKLVQLQARIDAAMECAIAGLNRVSAALEIASQESGETDQQISDTFTKIEDDPTPWNYPPLPNISPPLYPGYEPPLYPGYKPPLYPGYKPPLYPEPRVQPPVTPGEPQPIFPFEPLI